MSSRSPEARRQVAEVAEVAGKGHPPPGTVILCITLSQEFPKPQCSYNKVQMLRLLTAIVRGR